MTIPEKGTLRVDEFDAKSQSLWEYSPDNKLRFPFGKLSGPLLQVNEEMVAELKAAKNDKVRQCEILKSFAENREITGDNDLLKNNFWRCWQGDAMRVAGDGKRKGILPLLEPGEPLELAFRNREALGEFTTEKAQQEIRLLVLELAEKAGEGRIAMETVKNLLIGKWSEKEGKYVSKVVPLVLDFAVSLQTPEVRNRMNEVLLQNEPKENESEEGGAICALTGKRGAIVTDTFVQVNLPVLSQETRLLAMNKDVPCHNRYGRIAAEVCSIGKKTELEIANALLWITDEQRRGKTWRSIDREQKGKNDLLMIYRVDAPGSDVKAADTMGGDDDDREEDTSANGGKESLFVATVISVCKALKGQIPDHFNPTLRCIILREIDRGRRQVLYSESFTIEELERATQLWNEGAKNIPEMLPLSYPNKKGAKASLHSVVAPFLMAVLKLYQVQWKSDLSAAFDVHGISYPDVLEVFLDRGNRTRFSMNEMLEKLLRCMEPVLQNLGWCIHAKAWEKLSIPAKKNAVTTLATIGILLHKLGYKKEVYMNEMAYQLGRLLSLMDSLHVFYCKAVRGGDIPPQLLGNAFLSVVCDNPAEGIGRLMDRMKIYQAWANKYANEKRKGDETPDEIKQRKLAGWCLGEIGRTAEKIHGLEMSENRMSAVEKSCLLLGYLAISEKKSSGEEVGDDSPDVEEEQETTL
ncbi:MAG: hypothetical protein Q4D98_07045 [Planctomycetia bacterium]|nr:hypothetical protein [Planctomycetia bacterium]